jgi:DNA-binding transcriptional regulator YiaG
MAVKIRKIADKAPAKPQAKAAKTSGQKPVRKVSPRADPASQAKATKKPAPAVTVAYAKTNGPSVSVASRPARNKAAEKQTRAAAFVAPQTSPSRRGIGGTKRAATASSTHQGEADRGDVVAGIRRQLGVTQEIFARLIGVSARSIAGWERGGTINESSYRRVLEMERLAATLKKAMNASFIPRWLATPSAGLGGQSPIETLERGQNDRFWRTVFLLGSGLPL